MNSLRASAVVSINYATREAQVEFITEDDDQQPHFRALARQQELQQQEPTIEHFVLSSSAERERLRGKIMRELGYDS